MRWGCYKLVPIKRLALPGDIPARMKQPHVIELAESIKKLGADPIHAPSIDSETNKLLAGRDRMAAMMLLKAKAVWCHVAEDVTEQDALDLEVEENLHRRQDNRDELIARRVAKVAKELPDNLSGKSGGRPKSKEGAAREQVARELGTTPEAVRAAVKRSEEPDDAPAAPVELTPPVQTWGVDVAHLAQEFASVRIAQESLRAADRHLQNAQRSLAALEDGGGVAAHLHARLYTTVHGAAAAVRADIPTALCPYCKGTLARRAKCNGCRGIGYVGDEALVGVADELKLGGELACVPDGKGGFARVTSATPKKTKPAAPAKTLAILDENDNPIVVPPEDEEDAPF